TDGRYGELATELAADLRDTDVEVFTTGMLDALAGLIGDAPDVDIEAEHVTWAFLTSIQDKVPGTLHPSTGVVEHHRMVKDDDEVAALTAAATAGDSAFSAIADLAAGAATEAELGEALIAAMQDAGGERAGWPPIVATGPNAARPHHQTGAGAIGDGLLLVDYGCTVDGYHSDMTRTVWLDGAPDTELRRLHQAVAESNQAGIAAVRPGATGHDVDEACREVLRRYELEEAFLHSTGHGVGLQIHEAPSARRQSEDILEPGHVITVEPGAYLPGVGGVRIEDMVLVTDDGHRVLTESPRDLVAT
ncbi:MAG: aminopeptidase P family protein, partial [Actinomycetota bacterium]|nr:aminopeptidase P family protein [Actinomycetota bacterium]